MPNGPENEVLCFNSLCEHNKVKIRMHELRAGRDAKTKSAVGVPFPFAEHLGVEHDQVVFPVGALVVQQESKRLASSASVPIPEDEMRRRERHGVSSSSSSRS